MILTKILQSSAKNYPRRKALIFDKRKINYKELKEYVNKVRAGLEELGIRKNDKVGILLKNCPEFIISYFAILEVEAIVVPVNYMFKEEEIKYVLENSGSWAVITSSEFVPIVKRVRLRIEKLEEIIVVDKEISQTINFSQLLDSKRIEVSSTLNEDDVAAILYTSGTTGRPKGVMLTHRNLCSNVKASLEAIKLTKRDRFLCLLPMFHSFTWTVCVLMPIYMGATIFILDSIKPFKRVVKSIIKNRISIFVAIPPVYNVLTNISVPRIFTLPIFKFFNPLRICISGAAALSVEVIKKFEERFRIPLLEGYGLTEASPVVSINPSKSKRKYGSVGLPIPGVSVRVVDEEGNSLPFNTPGELLVKGENVMKGYYKLPEETDKVLRDGWLYTGDIAKIDKEGYIYIVDRKTDLIIVRGQNIYPREIEEIIYHNPKVSEAAVIGVKDKLKGEVPKAYVALKEGEEMKETELLKFLRERIAPFKIPKTIQFMNSLPKSPTGKILKRRLR